MYFRTSRIAVVEDDGVSTKSVETDRKFDGGQS